jgi:hypothetical protein
LPGPRLIPVHVLAVIVNAAEPDTVTFLTAPELSPDAVSVNVTGRVAPAPASTVPKAYPPGVVVGDHASGGTLAAAA